MEEEGRSQWKIMRLAEALEMHSNCMELNPQQFDILLFGAPWEPLVFEPGLACLVF